MRLVETPLLERIAGVLTFDEYAYSESAADTDATGTALLIVIGVGLLQGISQLPDTGLAGLWAEVGQWSALWAVWLLAVFVLSHALGCPCDLAALLRVFGLAAVPFGLGLLQELPWLGFFFGWGKWILGLAAASAATAQVTDLSKLSALGVCTAGLVLARLATIPLGWLFGN